MPMYEKPRKYTKMIASSIVGTSTFYVVKTVLRNNLPAEEEKKTAQVKASIGSGVIALIVAERTSVWTDDFVDSVFNAFDWSPKAIELEEETPSVPE